MQVVILAGGLGTRLHPLTGKMPKCMAQVAGRPFLSYLLHLFGAKGVDEIILCTGYMGEQVESYFGNGNEMGLKLRYSQEKTGLLGTGGALKLAEPLLCDSFLVINGDTYIDIDYNAIFHSFTRSSTQALIVTSPGDRKGRCDMAVDNSLMVTRYDKTGGGGLDYVNAGVMAFRREVVSAIAPACPVSLERDVFPPLISRRQVMAYITAQKFYDIGTFAGLDIFKQAMKEPLP